MNVQQWIAAYREHARKYGTFAADIAFDVDLDQSVAFLAERRP